MILTTLQTEFMPLLREVKDLGIVTMHPQFTKLLNDTDIPAKSLNEFITPEMVEAGKSSAAFSLLDYYNYSFTHELSEARHNWLLNKLPGYLYTRLADISTILLTLDEIQPSLIIVHNDIEPLNRALALWAKSRNKPCLHIPHAVYLEHGGRGDIGSDVHDLITASHVVCNGPFQAKWFIDRGVNKDNLFYTGLPQFDKLVKGKFTKERACKVLAQNPQRPVITYMSSWRQDTNLLGCHDGLEESYEEFLNAAKELPDIQYIVKCHPRANNIEYHKQKATEAGIRCIVLQDHLEPVLAASDLVISYGASNVLLEAAIHPHTRLSIVGDDLAFPNDPEITKIKSGTFVESIKQLLSEGPIDNTKLLHKYHFYFDGNNYLRIAELVKRLHK